MRVYLIMLFLVVPRVAIAQDCDNSQPQGGTGVKNDEVGGFVPESFNGDDRYIEDNIWYPDSSHQLPTCDSPSTNTRGRYTANLAPCVFTFHAVPEANGTGTLDDFETATVCGNDNAIGHQIMEYIHRWADECVGDFNRCYSLERDRHVYLDFVCAKKWKFPEGTTYLSVNCTTDKEKKEELLEKNGDDNGDEDYYFKEKQREMHKMEAAAIATLVLLFLLCICCCYAGHRWFVVPYQQSLTHHRQERIDLVLKESDDDNGTRSPAQVV